MFTLLEESSGELSKEREASVMLKRKRMRYILLYFCSKFFENFRVQKF